MLFDGLVNLCIGPRCELSAEICFSSLSRLEIHPFRFPACGDKATAELRHDFVCIGGTETMHHSRQHGAEGGSIHGSIAPSGFSDSHLVFIREGYGETDTRADAFPGLSLRRLRATLFG